LGARKHAAKAGRGKNAQQDSGHRIHRPLDKPEEKRETIPNLAPQPTTIAFGSGGGWVLTLCETKNERKWRHKKC